MRLTLLALVIVSTRACWFTSKSKTIQHIHDYINSHPNHNTKETGIARSDLELVQKDLPGALRWVVRKVGGIDSIMKRCDTNNDDFVAYTEAARASHCLTDCWKQSTVMWFLN
jgi:hypothetical protein